MTALLCTFALFALNGELKPLPLEKKLVDSEQVALQLGRLEVPKLGLMGWTKTTVQRAQLEGTTHYVVHRTAELVDFEELGLTAMESRGLYDADFNLVHEFQLKQPFGGDSKPLELEWGEEGFRWRKGRGRWAEGAGEVRPTATTDVPLLVHGLSFSTPWAGQVFDEKTMKLQAQTLQPGKKKTIDGQPVVLLEVEGPTPMRHLLTEDGVFLESKLEGLRIVGANAADDPEKALRRELADNEAFQKVLNQKLPASWSEKKGTYTSDALEMNLKLPKGWHRAPAREVEGTHFHAFSEDSNAYVSLAVTVLGTGYTLDDWSEGIVELYTELAVDGEVKTKKKSFAKQDALIFEFLRAAEAPLDSEAYAWERNGLGFLLIGGTWEKGPKKLHKETSSVLKSVKFAR